jgi:hypothetical protein
MRPSAADGVDVSNGCAGYLRTFFGFVAEIQSFASVRAHVGVRNNPQRGEVFHV